MEALKQLPKVRGKAQPEMEKIIGEAMREADDKLVKYVTEVMGRASQIAAEIIDKAKRDAAEESTAIIAKSRELANLIIYDAELKANEEVISIKERVTKRIISEAKEEAIEIITRATQLAEKESVRILENSMIETEAQYWKNQVAEKATGKVNKVVELSAKIVDAVKHKAKLDRKKKKDKIRMDWEHQPEEVQPKTDYNRLYQGRVELDIPEPVDFKGLMALQDKIREIASLRLHSVGGSAAGNTTIVVVLDEPLPLVRILAEMLSTRAIVNEGENIILFL
jgi:vacuolar-type H+-ATPase subunit H